MLRKRGPIVGRLHNVAVDVLIVTDCDEVGQIHVATVLVISAGKKWSQDYSRKISIENRRTPTLPCQPARKFRRKSHPQHQIHSHQRKNSGYLAPSGRIQFYWEISRKTLESPTKLLFPVIFRGTGIGFAFSSHGDESEVDEPLSISLDSFRRRPKTRGMNLSTVNYQRMNGGPELAAYAPRGWILGIYNILS